MTRSTAALADLRSGSVEDDLGPHFYVRLLGIRAYTTAALLDLLRVGLPYKTLERFQKNVGLPLAALAELLQIPGRTLARRKEQGRLQPDESDRLVRASRVFAKALRLFEGELEAAKAWLDTPLPALDRHSPLDFARTDVGAREVEDLIGRLEHGIPS